MEAETTTEMSKIGWDDHADAVEEMTAVEWLTYLAGREWPG